MSVDARDALRRLTAAFEEHLEAVSTRRSDDDAAVDDAYEALATAFLAYEEALDQEFAEGVPLVIDEEYDEGTLDGHAEENEDALDDDLDDFDLSR
ncbi:hypothetical protein [Demequina globuliformis]|uniref:hypothetical protein n=1 Tax=Demequina globuliformis TaxID=676202 RepID=UPI000780AF30|nr:hypothetical protein [Demequina globuliformis]